MRLQFDNDGEGGLALAVVGLLAASAIIVALINAFVR